MAEPLRLTSLIVKQVHACLVAELSRVGIAPFHINAAQVHRVLGTSPVVLPPSVTTPAAVALMRATSGDASVPVQRPPSILTSPIGRFASAAVLAQGSCLHSAHSIMVEHAEGVVTQVEALRRNTVPAAVEETLLWLHMALTVQAARLLPTATQSALCTAIKVRHHAAPVLACQAPPAAHLLCQRQVWTAAKRKRCGAGSRQVLSRCDRARARLPCVASHRG